MAEVIKVCDRCDSLITNKHMNQIYGYIKYYPVEMSGRVLAGGDTLETCDLCYQEIVKFINKKENEMDLKKWAKDNSKFIKLESGESFEGEYEGHKEALNMNQEPTIQYKIEGKTFNSSSGALAMTMSDIKIGTKVRITKFGAGMQTKYQVEVL